MNQADYDILAKKIEVAKMSVELNSNIKIEAVVASPDLALHLASKCVVKAVDPVAGWPRFMGMSLIEAVNLPEGTSYIFPKQQDAYTFVKLLAVLVCDGNTKEQSSVAASYAIHALAQVRP